MIVELASNVEIKRVKWKLIWQKWKLIYKFGNKCSRFGIGKKISNFDWIRNH